MEKRYSHFAALYKMLNKTFANMPPMPKKTLFKIKDQNKLELRRMGLENFMRGIVSRTDIFNNPTARHFLEVDKHAP